MVALIALDRLARRFPGLALDGEVTDGRIMLRGPARLPVSLGPPASPARIGSSCWLA